MINSRTRNIRQFAKRKNQKVNLIKDDILKLKRDDLFNDSKEQIIFLENIRFYEEEELNDTNFSKHLSKLADIFVNDAFSCSHRAHASVNKITKFLNQKGKRLFLMSPLHHHFELKGSHETIIVENFWKTNIMLVILGIVLKMSI